MSARTAAYAPIDVHAKQAPAAWPDIIPAMTAPESERAFRRLYRWATGWTYTGKVEISSGNRRAVRFDWPRGHWASTRIAFINPEKGWREFAHDASHLFDHVVNGESEHGKHHARFEAKLIRQIVTRGYLDGKLLDRERPKPEVVGDPKAAARLVRIARIGELETAWQRKLSRAERAIKKLDGERKRIQRAALKTSKVIQ